MVSQFHKLVLPLHGYSYDISKAARATGRGKSFINHINPDSGFSPFISFCPEYLPGTETKVHFRKLGILILHLPYRVLRSVALAKTSLSSAPVTESNTRGFQHSCSKGISRSASGPFPSVSSTVACSMTCDLSFSSGIIVSLSPGFGAHTEIWFTLTDLNGGKRTEG